jgi:hypothetical protein
MRRAKKEDLSFLEWSNLPMPSEWKIGYWDEEIPTSQAAKRKSKEQYNVADPEDFRGCRTNTYNENDWILTFQFKGNMPVNLSWLYVDFLAKTEKSDKAYISGFPYQAVQVWPDSRYPGPPFKIDKRFRDALAVAIKKYGISKFKKDDPYKLSKNLVELIQENY